MKVFILLSVVAVTLASQCGENQHYESCGTACPLTCENYDDPPTACVQMCNPGCHCDEGYVKTEDGRCVRPEECPSRAQQVCGENQRYFECGTACPLTCDNYANPPKICPLMCVIGCQCESGFVKTRDGRCVRPEGCPTSAPRPIEKSCLEEADTGPCKAYFPMWNYDVKTGKCNRFIYGGCQGNGNRYETEAECMENCKDTKLEESSVNRCDLPAETGPCRAFFRKYYFDKTTGQCQRFVYGGCAGNENNFQTIDECNQACGVQSAAEICTLPADSGLCYAYFPKYYWDTESGQCQKFIYGGCNGNKNRFETLEECQKTCA